MIKKRKFNEDDGYTTDESYTTSAKYNGYEYTYYRKYQDSHIIMEGEINKSGKWDGKVVEYDGITFYKGEFKNGYYHGEGRMVLKNTQVVETEFDKDKITAIKITKNNLNNFVTNDKYNPYLAIPRGVQSLGSLTAYDNTLNILYKELNQKQKKAVFSKSYDYEDIKLKRDGKMRFIHTGTLDHAFVVATQGKTAIILDNGSLKGKSLTMVKNSLKDNGFESVKYIEVHSKEELTERYGNCVAYNIKIMTKIGKILERETFDKKGRRSIYDKSTTTEKIIKKIGAMLVFESVKQNEEKELELSSFIANFNKRLKKVGGLRVEVGAVKNLINPGFSLNSANLDKQDLIGTRVNIEYNHQGFVKNLTVKNKTGETLVKVNQGKVTQAHSDAKCKKQHRILPGRSAARFF